MTSTPESAGQSLFIVEFLPDSGPDYTDILLVDGGEILLRRKGGILENARAGKLFVGRVSATFAATFCPELGHASVVT